MKRHVDEFVKNDFKVRRKIYGKQTRLWSVNIALKYENYLKYENASVWCWHEELKDKRSRRERNARLSSKGRNLLCLNKAKEMLHLPNEKEERVIFIKILFTRASIFAREFARKKLNFYENN